MTRHLTSLFLSLLITLFAVAAHAQHYKWQDDKGQWHFSDRPPEDDSEFETLGVPTAPRSMVSARRGGERHRPQHFFLNRYHGPAQVELRINEASNVVSDPPLPARFVIPGDTEIALVQFGPRDPTEPFSYRLSYTLVPGEPLEEIPANLAFYPPFSRDLMFPISQGLDDAQTHQDAANRYAVDIVMPLGTPVLAARGGVVMDSEQKYPDSGKDDERFLAQANYVRIAHDDGTMAVYAHLQRDSLRVVPGMRVPAGHWIGNSGNSGYSSGPHLHFVVQMNVDMALESLPISFRKPDGGIMDPDRPKMLPGVLPGAR